MPDDAPKGAKYTVRIFDCEEELVMENHYDPKDPKAMSEAIYADIMGIEVGDLDG